MKIFLLIGQSNMAGRGRMDEVSELKDSRIRMFRDGSWQEAVEPLHRDKPKIAGVGLGMQFAYELLQHGVAEDIGLIPCAVGGTPLERWMPGGDLYETALSEAQSGLKHGALAGILWHQGESDSHQPETYESYGERFSEMVSTLRRVLHAQEVPVITGELGPFLAGQDAYPGYNPINEQLHDLSRSLQPYACVSSAGLTDNGDALHFNAVSLREFGHRYAEAYLKLVSGE